MGSYVKVAWLVVMCMAVVGAPIAEAILCDQIHSYVAPCTGYLKSGGAVPGGCCKGLKTVLASTGTLVNNQTVCNCLEDVAASIKGLNPKNADSLPLKCKLNMGPYKFSTKNNCAKYFPPSASN